MAGPPPAELQRWVGKLPRRDANDVEALRALTHARVPWPAARVLAGASPYRARFRAGATLYPRRFFIVDLERAGRLGVRLDAPRVRGHVGPLDKHPWVEVEPPHGPVEKQFLRSVLLGETVAPYRMLEPVLGVVPLDGTVLLDAAAASEAGHRYLAAWLRDAEAKWAAHSNRTVKGESRMTLLDRINHQRAISTQAASPGMRVVYTKSGTLLSACLLPTEKELIDHMAYWTHPHSVDEAGYLLAVLNSEAVLLKITDLQPHGQRDKRHFDKLMWTLAIPEYDAAEPLHQDLAAVAIRAESIAAAVDLAPHRHFTAKRRAIRSALAADGIAAEIEALVDALLPP